MLRHPSPSAAPPLSVTPSLSAHLKLITAPAHRRTEALMNLPARLQSIPDYTACLQIFLRVFAPLEQSFSQFNQWEAFGIDIESRMRAPALHADLLALGAAIPPPAPATPAFASFAEALGGLYVTEGSTIGGQFITRAINTALGAQAAGKTAFFQGHGAETGPMWNRLRDAIDKFGTTHPAQQDEVAAGALATFARFAEAAAPP